MVREPQMVLVVEDNPDDEQLTLRALRQCEVPNVVRVARDGAEAVSMICSAEGQDVPALILLDLKLPKVSGIEVLQRIRANGTSSMTPVVVLTSSDEQRDIIASYESGANSYIRKPIDFNHFVDAVRELAQYWLTMNLVPPN